MTTAATTNELDTDALITWARLRELQTCIADMTAEAETLKGQLRDHLGTGSFTVAGRPAFTITTQRRFDPNQALSVLTPDEITACQSVVLDREKVEKLISPVRYDECKREAGKPTVRPA